MIIFSRYFFFGAALLCIMGCGSSRISSSWAAPATTYTRFENILVVGIINDKDRRLREQMELELETGLVKLGYTACASLPMYGPKAFEGLDEKSIIQVMKNTGADAMLSIVLLDKQKERRYVPGKTINTGEFWNYLGKRYSTIYEPGYYVTDTRYFWESNFYDLRTGTLLYSSQTKSFSPESTGQLAHEYGRLVLRDLQKKHLLHYTGAAASE